MKARAENLEVMVGTLHRDVLGWGDHVRLDGHLVKYWIWNALQRMPAGKKIRIRIEVLDDDSTE